MLVPGLLGLYRKGGDPLLVTEGNCKWYRRDTDCYAIGERGDIESTYNLGIKDVKPRPYSNNYALSVRLMC